MQNKVPDYRDLLKRELSRRKRRNSTYSLRAFARDLDLAAPRLSLILNRKQGLSRDLAMLVAQRLNWTLQEQVFFCDLVSASDARAKKERDFAAKRVRDSQAQMHSLAFIEDSLFSLISDWQHMGLLELALTKDFKFNNAWIASRLGIDEANAKATVQRLIETGLAEISKNGKFRPTNRATTTADGIPSAAIREFHLQILDKASKAVHQKIEERQFSSLVVAADQELLPEIFAKIADFRKELNQWITNHPENKKPDEVFCLGTQFFKLTNTKEN
jgi:uncharacterized protein (TIGR02147 family)